MKQYAQSFPEPKTRAYHTHQPLNTLLSRTHFHINIRKTKPTAHRTHTETYKNETNDEAKMKKKKLNNKNWAFFVHINDFIHLEKKIYK